jgi:hypothetical protein
MGTLCLSVRGVLSFLFQRELIFAVGLLLRCQRAGITSITGYFSATTFTFNNATFTNMGSGKDAFFFSIDESSGSTVGGVKLVVGGSEGDQIGLRMAHEPLYGATILGTFTVAMVIGSTTLTSRGGTDCFLAKYDLLGSAWVWATSFGSSGDDTCTLHDSFSLDSAKQIRVGGSFTGPTWSADIGSLTLTNTASGTKDGFVAGINYTTGGLTGAMLFGGPGNQEVTAMAYRSFSGPLTYFWAAGNFETSITDGTNTRNAVTGQDIFLATVNTNFTANSLGSADIGIVDSVKDIAFETSTNVVLLAGSVTTASQTKAFVGRWSSTIATGLALSGDAYYNQITLPGGPTVDGYNSIVFDGSRVMTVGVLQSSFDPCGPVNHVNSDPGVPGDDILVNTWNPGTMVLAAPVAGPS